MTSTSRPTAAQPAEQQLSTAGDGLPASCAAAPFFLINQNILNAQKSS